MDLFEYQAKDLFAEYGVPVQPGKVAHTAEEARDIAADFAAAGHPLVVVKAQVKTGGRGKAGGVKLADGPDEAYAKAGQILGMDIKGHTVHTVLIAQAVDIAAEYYLSFLLDRANRTFLSICTVQGGMEIEEVAHSSPGAVAQDPGLPADRRGCRQGSKRSSRPGASRRRPRRAPPCWPNGSGRCSPTRTPRWSRSTRWR